MDLKERYSWTKRCSFDEEETRDICGRVSAGKVETLCSEGAQLYETAAFL